MLMRFVFLLATDPTFFPMDWTSRKIMRNILEVQVVEKERRGQIKEVSPLQKWEK